MSGRTNTQDQTKEQVFVHKITTIWLSDEGNWERSLMQGLLLLRLLGILLPRCLDLRGDGVASVEDKPMVQFQTLC